MKHSHRTQEVADAHFKSCAFLARIGCGADDSPVKSENMSLFIPDLEASPHTENEARMMRKVRQGSCACTCKRRC
jgi:hypothetical protein